MANRFRPLNAAVVNNWKIKLLALVLAALSFYAIRGKTSIEVRYDIPLEVEVEEGVAILEQEPRTVQVTFRGSRQDLRDLEPALMRAVVSPKETDASGSREVELSHRNIEGATGVSVAQIRPRTARITFDREVERRLPVAKPKIRGKPLIGRAEIDYEPRVVLVRGPKRRLEIKEVFTEPIDVDGRVESFMKKVRVLSGDTWISEIEPSEITISVTIVTDTVTREFEDIAVLAIVSKNDPSRISFTPDRVKVAIHGPAETLDSIPEGAIRVFVDCVDLEPAATYDLPVNVHVPSRVDVNPVAEPGTVRVVLEGE